MLNKKLTTANVTVKNDGNQQMVRVQQMKRDQLLCKKALKQRESWIIDDDISSDVITTSSRKHLKPTTGQPARHRLIPPAGQPDASNSTSSLDKESSRKKADVVESYNPDARYPVAVFEDSAEAQISSRLESAAKQLTIYESWMSTAERNSNGENDKTQSTLKMERIKAEIESCKLPEIKGTRFVLFSEIVQFTEERCTYLERRQFGLDKRRKDLNLQSNGHIQTDAYIFEKRH
ncbi:hypothetical protein F511_44847 [Dorcoceras hygrometricum]|uniref:Uncharacterized protein n=1 Tax=Dorcoceras hygrometricum TaxID=472368 RepID=A0A2Z7C832_9LAMI|nr:hypothetical protein F511_44847 [Dorcoceras hygrometricum]